MKKWEFTFPPVSKEKWIEQIKNDLRQTPIESLHVEWWPGEKINPFHYVPDRYNEQVALPDAYFLHPPILTEWFDVESGNEETTNKNILTSLACGAQAIICDVSRDSLPDVSQLCNGVHLDMIEFSFNVKTDTGDIFNQCVLPSGVHVRIERGEKLSKDFIHQVRNLHQQLEGNILLSYEVADNEDWVDAAAHTFRTIIDDLNNWKASGRVKDFFGLCRLIIRPDKLYFKQIIQTRVLQQVWLNLSTAFEINENTSSPVECHIVPLLDSDPDRYLLRASSSSLAASLTGVRSICVHHLPNPEVPEFYKRIDLNIHHLLSLESSIYVGIDPVCGSYALDYYTRIWSEQIWEKVGGVDVMNFRQSG